jgi:drug/metabolite transporter (DMT)-like permease
MEYFFLLISAALFAAEFIFSKLYQKSAGESVKCGFLFSMLCSTFSCIFVFCFNGFKVSFSLFSTVFALVLAASSLIFNVTSIKTVHLGSLSVYTLFTMLGGMMIPFFMGIFYLNEKISAATGAGTVLIIISMLLTVVFGKDRKFGGALFYALCTVVFFANGMCSTIGKLHQIDSRAVGTLDYLVIVYGLNAVISLILFLCVSGRKGLEKRLPAKAVFSTAAYALLNGAATILMFNVAKNVDASLLYPIVTGGTILFSAVFSRIVYKEKSSAAGVVSLAIAFAGTVLFAL